LRYVQLARVFGYSVYAFEARAEYVAAEGAEPFVDLDVEVLALADRDRRVLLTFDKDFGELAFRQRLPSSCGIVLFRLNGADPLADNQRALAAIESRTDWAGSFSVITDDRIRMRPSQGT